MTLIADSLHTDSIADRTISFQGDEFVPSHRLSLTTYYSARDLASGIEGIPLPYTPHTDDTIAIILLACFCLSAFALARGKTLFFHQAINFVWHRDRKDLFAISTMTDVRLLLVLMLQTCVLGGIYIFNGFSEWGLLPSGEIPLPLILGIYTVVCLLYFTFKWVIYSFIGWIFFDKKTTSTWMESYFTMVYYLGFLLFPIILLSVYFDLKAETLFPTAIILVVFIKILTLYKWIKLFFTNISSLSLLILYFCALEIIPILLASKGLMELNDLLKIKT